MDKIAKRQLYLLHHLYTNRCQNYIKDNKSLYLRYRYLIFDIALRYTYARETRDKRGRKTGLKFRKKLIKTNNTIHNAENEKKLIPLQPLIIFANEQSIIVENSHRGSFEGR